jgi:DNA-directed RNA polymerase specialized sigma24 family protein
VTQYVLASGFRKRYSLKRGGGQPVVPLDSLPEGVFASTSSGEEDRSFNEVWARHIVSLALDKLSRDSSRLKVAYRDALVLRFFENKTYEEISARLGCKPHDVENYLFHGKRRLREHILELARAYSSSEDEHGEEMDLLKRYLP